MTADRHLDLANVLRADGDIQGALQEAEIASALRLNYTEALRFIAETLVVTGRRQEAVGAYLSWLSVEVDRTDQASGYRALARLYSCLDENHKAIQAARASLALEPNEGEAHALLAHYLIKLGLYDEALEHARRGSELAPDHTGCIRNFAVALELVGDVESAIDAWQSLSRLDPNDEDAKNSLRRLLESTY
jgi:tetratricopeptide (TPR) repeat protein